MSKPLDAIAGWLDASEQTDALQRAAKQYAREFRLAQHFVAQHLRNAAALSRTHGHEALLAALPAEVAQAIEALRGAMIDAWSALSSDPVPLFEEPAPPEA